MEHKEKCIKVFDSIQEYALYALIFFIPISKAAIEICFGIAFFGFFVKKILKPDFKAFKSPANIFLLLFFTFSALSIVNSGPYVAKSFKALFSKWFEYIWIYLLAVDCFGADKKRVRNAIFVLLAVATIAGIDGLTQKFLGIEFLRNKPIMQIKEGVYAAKGPFDHYNSFGAYIVVVLSIAAALIFSPDMKRKYRVGLVLPCVTLALSLLFTFSRGSWVGFMTAAALMLLLSRNFKIIIPLVITFLALLFLLPQLRERFLFTFQVGGDATRFTIWQAALTMIKENPLLGKGIGTFMDRFPDYAPNMGAQYAHNSYLQMWAETGLLSLLSFLSFSSLLLLKGIKTFSKHKDFVILGLVCGIAGFLTHGLFDNHLYVLQLSALFWSIAGILSALIKTMS